MPWLTNANDSLKERINISKVSNADIFISIHCNSNEAANDANGIETWYKPTSSESERLASIIQSELVSLNYSSDRGIKYYSKDNELAVVEKNSAISVLTEVGFLSNRDDERYLSAIKTEIPFSSMIDIAGAKEGMKAIIRAALENIEAAVEGNTIAIKANICLNGKILYEISKEFICDVVEEEGDKPQKKASITIYAVGEGDTLWGLAKKYSTTVEQLKSINGLEENENIEVGQKLIIPGRADGK